MKFTARMCAHIAQGISQGSPIWALLLANEYLNPQCPIRLALVRKAETQLPKNSIHHSLIERIKYGQRLESFSSKEQAIARSLDTSLATQKQGTRHVPIARFCSPNFKTKIYSKRALKSMRSSAKISARLLLVPKPEGLS